MKRYLFLGDTHGNMAAIEAALAIAQANAVTEIIQVGDWGFVWPRRDGQLIDHAARVSDLCIAAGVMLRYIDGNHDVHVHHFAFGPGDHNVQPNLTYQPRGSSHVDEDGTRFVFLGGADSVDKEFRRPGTDWWPSELITDADVAAATAHGAADVLVTHTSPLLPPTLHDHGFSAEILRTALAQRRQVARVVEAIDPRLLVHGHFHTAYQRRVGDLQIVGLGQETFRGATWIWQRDAG